MFQIVLPLCVSLCGLCLVRFIGIPGGTFLGTVFAAALVRFFYEKAKRPPKFLQSLARTLLGLAIGLPVNRHAIETAMDSLVPIVLMIIGLIGLSFLSAWLASRLSGMDFTTALCGASPGAAPSMVVLSDDLGGQTPLVTVLHTLRMLIIMILMPLGVGIFQPEALLGGGLSVLQPAVADAPSLYYAKLALLAAGGISVAYFFKRWRIPTAEILAGILVASICNPLFLHIDKAPRVWQIFSTWMVATNMGTQMSREALRAIRRYIFVCGGLTIILLTMGFILGYLLYATTSLDLLTALLGSCPGSMDTMILFAGEMHADVPIVAAMHTARQILVTLTMPFIIRKLIIKKEGPAA